MLDVREDSDLIRPSGGPEPYLGSPLYKVDPIGLSAETGVHTHWSHTYPRLCSCLVSILR